ncbi:hypothetical protein LCGC14_0565740 [marine sediment metagenome]|uniref:Uncharacterized protein n=1 Tax=marine sediment metagenome TaxID=412755 RepID=A0A0F9S4A9_9ZZZZ
MTRVQEKNLDRRSDWLYTRGVIVVMSTFLVSSEATDAFGLLLILWLLCFRCHINYESWAEGAKTIHVEPLSKFYAVKSLPIGRRA